MKGNDVKPRPSLKRKTKKRKEQRLSSGHLYNPKTSSGLRLMIQDAEVTRDELVLQDGSVRDGDLVALVGDDDDGASKGDVLSEPNVAVDGDVVGLEDVGDRLEPLLEVGDLLEGVCKDPIEAETRQLGKGKQGEKESKGQRTSELDNGGGLEDPAGVHDERSVLERVQVRGDEEQVRARLDGEETRSGDVDTLGVSEVLDGGSDSGLELDDGLSVVGDLVVDAGGRGDTDPGQDETHEEKGERKVGKERT
jgi:hypothetical protein